MTGAVLQVAVQVATVALCAGVVLAFWRVARGPSAADRIVALDLIGLEVMGLILVHAVEVRSEYLIDVAIVVAVLVFLSTVAMASYVSRR